MNSMECKRKREITDVIEATEVGNGTELEIKNIDINGVKYALKIYNSDNPKRLDLDFNNSDYTVRIDSKGIRFQRMCHRPNHDHNNREDLYIDKKTGKLRWGEHKLGSEEYFYVDFGAKEVDY